MNRTHYISAALLGLTLTATSCQDFLTILPTDKTVREDYWKTKDDVQQMVTGSYKYMINQTNIEHMIIWGDFRSDETTLQQLYTNTDLENIEAINLLPSNSYNSWRSMYQVINNCNIVLAHAPEVRELDPEFTDGDYQVARAQMLALRSLCYFYLVRTFRDIPYTTTAFESDDQEMLLAQSAPVEVLQHCIDDLNEALPNIYRTGTFPDGDWRNTGLFTRDAVNALLADIYLWKGSMTHDNADYQLCVEAADRVIDSKDAYYNDNKTGMDMDDNTYHLIDGQEAAYQIFGRGNSSESILELQFDGNNNDNTSVKNYYFRNGSGAAHARLVASSVFGSVDANMLKGNSGSRVFATQDDYRFWSSCFGVGNSDETQFDIRKMVDNSTSFTTKTAMSHSDVTRLYSYYNQNWIVYRLTDVLLMKAEALTAMSGNDDEQTLSKAFYLVKAVNDRSLATGSKDSLDFTYYDTKSQMETLVLQERTRELCFEGKRWYDLVRYCYRHMDNVDASRTMYDITQSGASLPALSSDMVSLVARKYTSGGDAVGYKMKTEAHLYFPIAESETKVDPLLHQNPEYVETESIERNN
jgi:starch-binding outer membrane protein, SusD/RagB family